MISCVKIAVIIPTFNRKEVTKKCVVDLLKNTLPPAKIIICDSDSSDGTREEISKIKNVSVLNVGSESWWSAAVNRGIEAALKENFEFILVINDDIDFDNDLIENLFKKAELNPSKIISPAQKNAWGTFLGIRFLGRGKEHHKIWVTRSNEAIDVESTNGCCLLIPAETFKRVGLFNEKDCPHLFGDTEFQLRAWNSDLGTRAFSDVVIGQQASTDYFRRQKLLKLFTYPASPVHFRSYIAYGIALFDGSFFKFMFLGVKHHRAYVYSLLKTTYIVSKANLKKFGLVK